MSLLVALDSLVAGAALAGTLGLALMQRRALDPASTAQDAWTIFPLVAHLPLLLLCLVGSGLYRPRRDATFTSEFWDLARAVVIAWVILVLALLFARRPLLDRLVEEDVLLTHLVLMLGLLTLHRFAFRLLLRALRRRGWNQRHIAIIGAGRLGQTTLRTLTNNSWTGINCAYFVSHHDAPPAGDVPRRCLGRPVLGGLDDLERTLDRLPVDGVILALPQSRNHRLPNLLARLERYPVEVRIIPDISPRYMPMNLAVAELDGLPVLTVRQSPMLGYGALAKRIVDLVIALGALVVFGVPMALVALLIRLESPGPILYRQQRAGLGGKPFSIYKFRTMYLADAMPASAQREQGTEAWTHRDDPRITRIGRVMRRLSLDELPQLLNVLKGEMSLVGPRPERIDLLPRLRDDTPGYMLRSNVKAGMTGWAQVNGLRGDTSLRKRLQYDLYYVRHWSLLFDLRILWLTLFRGFHHPNAH